METLALSFSRKNLIVYNEMKGGMYDDYIIDFRSYFIRSDSSWSITAFSRRYFITAVFRRCYSSWFNNLCYYQTHLEKASQKIGGAFTGFFFLYFLN